MAFKINNKLELRNIQEQVQKNKEDIANHYAIDRALANFGIKIVGTVATPEELPDPLTYVGEYGDGYAVGQPGSYIYYIYTRPDPNAGKFDNYWLDVGSISIVGPEGPQGPQGEKGDTGNSTRWYTGEYQPSNPNVGDLYLNNQGQIYQYSENNVWVPTSSITGPQGIQGIQGIPGIQGPQGPQGPKGDTGDVGGFINIWGTLSNTNQLPTPQSLNNLTVAYLIEHTGGTDNANDHYDLYIQVGESSEEAVWLNAGPFNAATLVTVNGLGQNVWDADTKVNVTDLKTINNESIIGTGNISLDYVPINGGTMTAPLTFTSDLSIINNSTASILHLLTAKGYNIVTYSPGSKVISFGVSSHKCNLRGNSLTMNGEDIKSCLGVTSLYRHLLPLGERDWFNKGIPTNAWLEIIDDSNISYTVTTDNYSIRPNGGNVISAKVWFDTGAVEFEENRWNSVMLTKSSLSYDSARWFNPNGNTFNELFRYEFPSDFTDDVTALVATIQQD